MDRHTYVSLLRSLAWGNLATTRTTLASIFHFVCKAWTDHRSGGLPKFLVAVNAFESSELIASLPAKVKVEFRDVFIKGAMQEAQQMKKHLAAELIQQFKTLAEADSQCDRDEAIKRCDEAIGIYLGELRADEDGRAQDDMRALFRNGVMVHEYFWERDDGARAAGDLSEIKQTCNTSMHAASSIGPLWMQQAILGDMSKKCQAVLDSLASGCVNAVKKAVTNVQQATEALQGSLQLTMASDDPDMEMGSDEWMAKMSNEEAPKLSKDARKWTSATSAIELTMQQEALITRMEKLQCLPAGHELDDAKAAALQASQKAILESQAVVLFYALKTTYNEAKSAKGVQAKQLRTNLSELVDLCKENTAFKELPASTEVLDECRELASAGSSNKRVSSPSVPEDGRRKAAKKASSEASAKSASKPPSKASEKSASKAPSKASCEAPSEASARSASKPPSKASAKSFPKAKAKGKGAKATKPDAAKENAAEAPSDEEPEESASNSEPDGEAAGSLEWQHMLAGSSSHAD